MSSPYSSINSSSVSFPHFAASLNEEESDSSAKTEKVAQTILLNISPLKESERSRALLAKSASYHYHLFDETRVDMPAYLISPPFLSLLEGVSTACKTLNRSSEVKFPPGVFDKQSFEDYLNWTLGMSMRAERSIQNIKALIDGAGYFLEKNLYWQILSQLADQKLSSEDELYLFEKLHHMVFEINADQLAYSRPIYLLESLITKNPEKYLSYLTRDSLIEANSSSGKNEVSLSPKDDLAKIQGRYSPEVLIYALYELKRFEEAQALFDKVLTEDRENHKGCSCPRAAYFIAYHYFKKSEKDSALKYLDYAKDSGETRARCLRAEILLNLKPGDKERLLLENIKQGCIYSQVALGIVYYNTGRREESIKLLQLAADQGFASAQLTLGTFYYEGRIGGAPNYVRAAELWQLAADQGDMQAHLHLGNSCYEGRVDGVANYTKAAELWQLAAIQGDARAQYSLGVLYDQGKIGGTPNYTKAAEYYQAAASQGYEDAQHDLGVLYDQGKIDGVPNYTKAAELWELAAAQGHEDALQHLHLLFPGGVREPNYTETVKRYQSAANRGGERDQFYLGLLYYEGKIEGMPNYIKAAELWQLAADQRSKDARFRLGLLYYEGKIDGEPNYTKAAELWQLAANQGCLRSQKHLEVLRVQGKIS